MISLKSFSKLTRQEKIDRLAKLNVLTPKEINTLNDFWFSDEKSKLNLETISENVISHYFLPFSVAPEFIINNIHYNVPMVTEESSVVAAASSAAKFWASNGGFLSRVISTQKVGQIHFNWKGSFAQLVMHREVLTKQLINSAEPFLANMHKRGGGISAIEFIDLSDKIDHYFQLRVSFETADAMGANIINTCLETMALCLKEYIAAQFTQHESECDIIMAILSNHTPDCLVECKVSCQIDALQAIAGNFSAKLFAERFKQAVDIASIDSYRAATHNKGIFNGIDAVVLATGNDFRAVEAGGHAYAANSGAYKALSSVSIENETFTFTLLLPLAIGTVGGLTSTHPMVQAALSILNRPSAKDLMQIAAAVGLANNFSAIRALVTSGIQQGHMKFHLSNILQALSANEAETLAAKAYFSTRNVSHAAVVAFLQALKNKDE